MLRSHHCRSLLARQSQVWPKPTHHHGQRHYSQASQVPPQDSSRCIRGLDYTQHSMATLWHRPRQRQPPHDLVLHQLHLIRLSPVPGIRRNLRIPRNRKVIVTFSMVGFVDDSTGTINSFRSHTTPTPESLLKKMQHDAQLWHDLLWCSGGMLELPKCSYHFLYFDFEKDGTPIPRGNQVGPSLTIQSPTNQPVSIPSKSVYNPHKTLGHYKAPAGTGKTQIQKL
jgi:hypothetical protein